MRKYDEKLNIVDENDNIIGEDTRENIHKKGLLHREIHVWVFNDNGGGGGEILFQKRGPHKDTFPNLLDASAGGHVDLNQDYQKAALKELEEEISIKTTKNNLIFIRFTRGKAHDKVTGNINNSIRAVYTYQYNNEELIVEDGKADKLEFWPINKLFNLTLEEKNLFIPSLLNPERLEIFKQIQDLIKK